MTESGLSGRGSPPRDHREHRGRMPRSKPFSLYEALPYSPQSSVIPFLPGFIPDPSIGSGSLAPRLADLFDPDEFNALNKDNGNGQLKQLADSLLMDMIPNIKTHYKFPPLIRSKLVKGMPVDCNGLAETLTPLAKAVFDRIGGSFRNQDPYTAGKATQNGQHPPSGLRQATSNPDLSIPTSTVASGYMSANFQASRSNSASIIGLPLPSAQAVRDEPLISKNLERGRRSSPIENDHAAPVLLSAGPVNPKPTAPAAPLTPRRSPAVHPSTPTASAFAAPADGSVSKSGGAIRIELPAVDFDPSEYVECDDSPGAPFTASARKRTRDGYLNHQGPISSSLNQRQTADAAVRDLCQLSKEISIAIPQISIAISRGTDLVLEGDLANNHDLPLFFQKAINAIQKTLVLSCFDMVPLDDLRLFLHLSDATLMQFAGQDFKIDECWDESHVKSWLGQLPKVDSSLKAARTALRIMSGGRKNKQLYSESLIQQSLDIFKKTIDGIIVPIVELRHSGHSASLFKLLTEHRKRISSTFLACQRLYSVIIELVVNVQLSDMILNSLEFASSHLMFVENASYEKDSVIGIQKFDGLRLLAMEMLCQLFLSQPQQRQGILDEILTSLEKLPLGKLSARNFRLTEGSSIQPVSALIMRLVQASSRLDSRQLEPSRAKAQSKVDGGSSGPEIYAINDPQGVTFAITSEEAGATQVEVAIRELSLLASPLFESAMRNGTYVLKYIVDRAMKSTKSGDAPYRNLLDLLVEDFTTCLDLPDWPASEMLLGLLVRMMSKLADDDKKSAPAKNMALDTLGMACAAISKLRSHVRKTASSLNASYSDEFGISLVECANSALNWSPRPEVFVDWSGPFRTTLEYQESQYAKNPHLGSTIAFIVMDWATRLLDVYHSLDDRVQDRDREFGRLAYRLRMMIGDRSWLSAEYTFATVNITQAKLAHATNLLRSSYFGSFRSTLNILLNSTASDQATVRSKSLKSINQVIETDPSILEGDFGVLDLILECSNDRSPQVRDAALGLMGKCIILCPHLEEKMIPRIVERFVDNGVGVRKRAMKLAKEAYLRNQGKGIRSAIANGLLHRVQDLDDGVRDLACHIIEEVWFASFYDMERDTVFQTLLAEHVSLVIHTVKSGNMTVLLEKVLVSILSPAGVTSSAPFRFCSDLVTNIFRLTNTWESTASDTSVPSARDALQVLMIFAKASPKLFSFEQIKLLKPHLAAYANVEDILIFRAVVIIYRRVFPLFSAPMHKPFLTEVCQQLINSVNKASRILLEEVIPCLWIICGHLALYSPLVGIAGRVLKRLQQIRSGEVMQQYVDQVARCSLITGLIGKYCNIDDVVDSFKDSGIFPGWQGSHVSRLMVDILIEFTTPSEPKGARRAALDAIGLICQSSPRNYVLPIVYTTFQKVFLEYDPDMETVILTSFKDFLLGEEQRSAAVNGCDAVGKVVIKKTELAVIGGSINDDVASATTQRFLKDITRIALASQDKHSFLALEVLASISRQGLVHPKDTGATLIALETSPNVMIAELAFLEHRMLHEKHETVIEREYAKTIHLAYTYQRDVVKDLHGATTNPFRSKLHLLMEVLKISKTKNRQRFFEKMCNQLLFDPAGLDTSGDLPPQVGLSRFVLENLAFFDYVTIGELLCMLGHMEKVVASTGTTLAHLIECEAANVHSNTTSTMPATILPSVPPIVPSTTPTETGNYPAANVPEDNLRSRLANLDAAKLRQYAASSIILLSLWEVRTYLRRLYGLDVGRKDVKTKAPPKDLAKAPVKVPGMHGDKLWAEIATVTDDGLQSRELMAERCKALVELMNVDHEFEVVEPDEDAGDAEHPSTPTDGQERPTQSPATDWSRKRKAASTTPGSRKKRARSGSRVRARGRPRKQKALGDDDEPFDDDDLA